jgi:hypothetical protein
MLKAWQAKKVRASSQPTMRYLIRLRDRMDNAALRHEKLYEHVCKAPLAMP